MLTAIDFLSELRSRGARRLRCVRFRENRSTIWSLTRSGTVLNVHSAFRAAPDDILDAFSVVVTGAGTSPAGARAAAQQISNWPVLAGEIERLRARHERRLRRAGEQAGVHCCASPAQRTYLMSLYRYFNATRFDDALPEEIPVRLSSRMKSSLGHMMPGERDGRRYVVEIALNCDLMLPGNGAERVDTLLHEMAHAADWLFTGEHGHGASWKEWARRAGCQPTRLYERPVRYRKDRRASVRRVPPLPSALHHSCT